MSTVADERPDDFVEPPASGETNRWLVLVIVCLAQFMVMLDATVVNVALPSIQADLGFSRREPAVGDQQLHARLRRLPAARRARRRPVRAAQAVPLGRRDLLVRVAAQRARHVATRGSSRARALQGLGGALVSPAALSIITTTFAEGEDRTKALGVWSAIAAGGGAFGLLLGGILTDLLSWEWIFFVNVPIGIATRGARAPLRARVAGAARGPAASTCPGAITVTAGLIVLVYAIVKAEDFGWGSAPHARARRDRDRAARRVRRHRAPHAGAADPARHLPRPLARGREHRAAARRRRPVRVLLLLVALRPADPRLLAARGRPRVPARHGRDRDRRRRSRSSSSSASACARRRRSAC